MSHILNYIVGLPFLAALIILVIPRNYRFVIRIVANVAMLLVALLACKLFFFDFVTGFGREQLQQKLEWVPLIGIQYHVAVDGLNVGLVLMSAIVGFGAVAVSWEIKERVKEFYILLLVMAGGVIGAFASFDLFFFYFFHELALVPTFIMIGIWGRGKNKTYATFQITLYLSVGALLALIGLLALYLQLPPDARTFDLVKLTQYIHGSSDRAAHGIPVPAQNIIFPFLLFGFGILVSLWPFHTWAPLGYGSAPTGTAMLHAGALKKFGLYGLLRVAMPLLPDASQSWVQIIAFLCLGNIIHCGLVAIRQRDLNLLIGNSSVAHMGFIFLGLASSTLIGVTGAVVIMIAHGFLAALSFALSGYLHAQTGTLEMEAHGGLLRRLPLFGTLLIMAMLAGCGLPGFANFAGEMLVLFGAWKAFPLVTFIAIWGALVIGGVYMLRAIRTLMHGPPAENAPLAVDLGRDSIPALGWWRRLPYCALLIFLLVFGFFPRLLTDKIAPSAKTIVAHATGQEENDLPGKATTASLKAGGVE